MVATIQESNKLPKEYIELEDGRIIDKEQFELEESILEERKLAGEWIAAKGILGELITNNFSYESWYDKKDSLLIGGRISWETWSRYYTENKEDVISRLIDSTEYKDVCGKIIKLGNDDKNYIKVCNLPEVKVAGDGLLISKIAKNVADIFSKHETLFYKQEIREIVEVSKIDHDEKDKSFLGFSIIKPKRFITLSEKYLLPCVYVWDDKNKRYKMIPKSLSIDKSNIILASPHFQESMPVIKRIFSVPMPMMYEGNLTFPNTGYDRRFYSWLNPSSPKINNLDMNIQEAKSIIENMFSEFCFEKEQDYTNAVAGLITPFLRGLFPDFTTRTPMFFYVANRERAGKDYLASITGLVLEGQSVDEPPISDGENSSNKNDELRKKLLSCVLQGRRRLHFANNKGRINNSVLEAALTSRRISDRILGKNEVVSVDNELDISASGNVGITFTPDLSNRCIFVKLFLDVEDANKRSFSNPNLHGWVMENRELVLSAIYCLINNWVKKGSKSGKERFASYPEWADICGGIMENAGFMSPCVSNDDALVVGGDTESQEMKYLFELCYSKYPDKQLAKSDMINIIKQEDDLFNYINWEDRRDQVKFGKKLIKFYGRVFSDIRLSVVNPNERSARQKLMFTKEEKNEIFKIGNVGNLGNILSTPITRKDNKLKKVLTDSRDYHTLPKSKIPVEIGQFFGNVVKKQKIENPESQKVSEEKTNSEVENIK